MKSMTLFIGGRSSRVIWRDRPPPVQLSGATFTPELLEMGVDVLRGRRHERRRESIIDGFDNRRHAVASGREGSHYLGFAHSAVGYVIVQQRPRMADVRAVRGPEVRRRQRQQTFERLQILPEVATPRGM